MALLLISEEAKKHWTEVSNIIQPQTKNIDSEVISNLKSTITSLQGRR